MKIMFLVLGIVFSQTTFASLDKSSQDFLTTGVFSDDSGNNVVLEVPHYKKSDCPQLRDELIKAVIGYDKYIEGNINQPFAQGALSVDAVYHYDGRSAAQKLRDQADELELREKCWIAYSTAVKNYTLTGCPFTK